MRVQAGLLHQHGGAIGNSRVKLTNVKDCVKRGLVQEGQDFLKVALISLPPMASMSCTPLVEMTPIPPLRI